MKRLLSLSIIAVFAAIPVLAARRVVPIVGHTPGANNTFWTTDVQVSNSTTNIQTVRLTFHPQGRSAVSRDVTLSGNESVLLEDAVGPTSFGLPDDTNWIGELEIEGPDDFSATARTFTRAPSGSGTFGSVSEAVDPSLFATHGTVTGILVDDRFRSNVALTNATDDTVTVHFDVRRRDGSIAASDDVPVGPHQAVQKSIGSYLHRADDSPASLQWTANNIEFVSVSVVDNRSGDPSDSHSVSAPGRTMFYPIVGKTPGANGTFWTTSVSITNTEDSSGDATIDYQGNDGSHISRTVTIQPRGTFHTEDVFQFLNVSSGSGFLTITSTVDVTSGARVFNTREDGGTFGSTLMPQDRVSRSALVHIRGVRRDDDFRLNVAIADENPGDADGTIHLFDDRHNEVESRRFHVPAHSALQFPIVQTTTAVRAGEIEVETEHGIEVTVIASNIDNRSGDTVVAESEQENERQQELEIRMSAKSARTGEPITFTAVTPSNAQIASIQWDFGDGTTATGQTATHAFASGGEFKVTLIVTLASGAKLRKAEDVEINGTPAAGATAFDFTWSPSAPQPGQTVTFTGHITGSAPANSVVKWKIDGVRTTGATTTHTFTTAGSFEAEAELDQEGGNTLQAAHVVTVGTVAPPPPGPGASAIDFTWSPASPNAGDVVTFTATITGTPIAGSQIKWRMQDGSRPSGGNTTFKFTAAGTYSVQVELEQPGKATIQAEHHITVK